MTAPQWRRFLPPRQRPGLFAIAIRWRVEIVVVALVLVLVYRFGVVALAAVGVAAVLAAAVIPAARFWLARVWQLLATPHRVRAGLVQAGVTDRVGRPPWILLARSAGRAVRVELRLRAGVTVEDLCAATQLVQAACGASGVDVVPHPIRSNRAALDVARPMWGLPCSF